MSKESNFTDRLDDFTNSLESLVELLKDQANSNPSEVINKLVSKFDDNLGSIVSELKVIKKDVQAINTKTDKILEVVKEEKESKSTGMFGEIEGKSNKDKIIGAVKTVVLIAAGVLAIGLAFKIVGDVDFLSVVALGMGIMFAAYAFAQVASIKDDKGKPIDFKRAGLVSVIMIIMATALLVSGLILKLMPVIGLMEFITIIGVGLTLGLATYFILKAIGNVKLKSLLFVPLLPVILPLIALGLVFSGSILTAMPIVGASQLLSAVGVSLAMAPVLFGVGYMAKGLKNTSMTDILLVGLVMPIIALGVVAAAIILKLTPDVPFFAVVKAGLAVGLAVLAIVPSIILLNKFKVEAKDALSSIGTIAAIALSIVIASIILQLTVDIPMMNVIHAGIGIGIATLAMLPTLIVIKKTKLSMKDIVMGGLAIVMLSAVIMISSLIIGLGSYGDYPSVGWALGVGLSVIAFTLPLIVLGLIIATGIGLPLLGLGAIGVLLIVATIVAVSYLIQLGDYSEYPSIAWAIVVGMLILTVSATMVIIGLLLPLIFLGAISLMIVVASIVGASHKLNEGEYDTYPDLAWSAAFINNILVTAGVMVVLGVLLPFLALGALSIMIIASTIVWTSHKLNEGTYENFPSWRWALGTGLAMLVFGIPMLALGLMVIASFGMGLGMLAAGTAGVLIIADAIQQSSHILAKGTYEKGTYPSLAWSHGVGSAIMVFAKALAIQSGLSLMSKFFGGKKVDLSAFIIKITNAIVEAGTVLTNSGGKFEKGTYPSFEWSHGVGTAIMTFARALAISTELEIIAGLFGKKIDLSSFIVTIATALTDAGTVLTNKGFGVFNKGTYPDVEWSRGVGTAIITFARALAIHQDGGIFGLFTGNLPVFIETTTRAIVKAGEILSETSGLFEEGTYPTEKWAKGVGGSILIFADAVSKLSGFDTDLEDQEDGDSVKSAFIVVSRALVAVGEEFQGKSELWKLNNIPGIKFAHGIGETLLIFAKAIEKMKDIGVDLDLEDQEDGDSVKSVMLSMSRAVIAVGDEFKGKNELWNLNNIPSKSWAETIISTLETVSTTNVDIDIIEEFVEAAEYLVEIAEELGKIKPIGDLTNFITTIKILAPILEYINVDEDKIEDFADASEYVYDASVWLGKIRTIGRTATLFVNNAKKILNTLASFRLSVSKSEQFVDITENIVEANEYLSKLQDDPIGNGVSKLSYNLKLLKVAFPNTSEIQRLQLLTSTLERLSRVNFSELKSLGSVGRGIGEIATSINRLNEEKIKELYKIGAGFQLISLVDNQKLIDVMDTLEEKSDVLSDVIDDKGIMYNFLDSLLSSDETSNNSDSSAKSASSDSVGIGGVAVDEVMSQFETQMLNFTGKIEANIDTLAAQDVLKMELSEEQAEYEEELRSKDVGGGSWSD